MIRCGQTECTVCGERSLSRVWSGRSDSITYWVRAAVSQSCPRNWWVEWPLLRRVRVEWPRVEWPLPCGWCTMSGSALVEWPLSLLTGPGTWLSGRGPRCILFLGDFIDVYLDDRTTRRSARLHDAGVDTTCWQEKLNPTINQRVLSDRKVTECYLIAR